MAPVRLCIVGCGVIVDSHLLAIAAASPAEFVVTALVDPNAEAREKIAARVVAELGTETPAQFASLTDALIADPDALMFEAVDLLVPSVGTLHEDISIEAMRAGRHVLLEKPVAVSMDSATRILAASEELMASKVFMVAENSQYISEIVAAQNLIREGAIGCVLSCE
jgi:predicted dehydrogenase